MMKSCIGSSIIYLYFLLVAATIPLQMYSCYYYTIINRQVYLGGIIFFSVLIIILKITELVFLLCICYPRLKGQKKYCIFLNEMHHNYETNIINTNGTEPNDLGICPNFVILFASIFSLACSLLQLNFSSENGYSTLDTYGTFLLIFSSVSPLVQIICFIIITMSVRTSICTDRYCESIYESMYVLLYIHIIC